MSVYPLEQKPDPGEVKALNPNQQTCYRIQAEVEVSVLARVLELFTLRSLIPDQVKFQRTAQSLELDIRLPALSKQQSEHLARRIRNILPVRTVVWLYS